MTSNDPQGNSPSFDIDTTLLLLEITAHRRSPVISPQWVKVLGEMQRSMTQAKNAIQASDCRTQIYTAAELELISLSSGPKKLLEGRQESDSSHPTPHLQTRASRKQQQNHKRPLKQRSWSHLGLCHRHMNFWYRLRVHCIARHNMENMHATWRQFLEQQLQQRLGETCFSTVLQKCPTNDDWVRWWMSRAQLLRRHRHRKPTPLYHTCFPTSLIESPWLLIALRFYMYCCKWQSWNQVLETGYATLRQQLCFQPPPVQPVHDHDGSSHDHGGSSHDHGGSSHDMNGPVDEDDHRDNLHDNDHKQPTFVLPHRNKTNPLLSLFVTLPEYTWLPSPPHPSNDFLRILKLYHKSIRIKDVGVQGVSCRPDTSSTTIQDEEEDMEKKLDLFYAHLSLCLESLECQVEMHHQWTRKCVLPLIPRLCYLS